MKKVLMLLVLAAISSSAMAAISYDQNVTNNVIFGTGVGNGAFTVDRANGIELGLRAKLRHNASGNPQPIYNSNADGTYSFNPGIAPTQAFPTAEWSYEWSINSNYDGNGNVVGAYDYKLSMTSTTGAELYVRDVIAVGGDHSFGDNSTAQSSGLEATSIAEYGTYISTYNIAQNSWKPHWEGATGFDPTDEGIYTYVLSAFDKNSGEQLASTSISVIVGNPTVPAPGAMLLAGIGTACVGRLRRRML